MFFCGRKYLPVMAAVLLATLVCQADSLGDLRGLKTKGSRFPLYHKDRLQLMIYSAETERNGNMIVTTNPVLDIIRRDVDIDDIVNTGGVTFYPLAASLPDVLLFWKDKLYSEGLIKTAHAEIDQENKRAGGAEAVFFRSPLLDLDGVGFEADFDKKSVFVKKDVHIILRMGGSDPRKLLNIKGGKPGKYEFLRATCDSMLIDSGKNEIKLIGNVVVKEPRGTVSCDLLTIYTSGNKKKSAPNARDGNEISGDIGGISSLVFEGNVAMVSGEEVKQSGKPQQRGAADKVTYSLEKGLITMTGLPGRQPLLAYGDSSIAGNVIEIFREQERMKLYRDCRILSPGKAGEPAKTLLADNIDFDYKRNSGLLMGNVKFNDGKMALNCPRMLILLREHGNIGKKAVLPGSDSLLPEIGGGNKRELQQLQCLDGVRAVQLDGKKDGSTISSDRTIYDSASNTVTFIDKVKVRDPRMELDCRKLTLFLAGEPAGKKVTGNMLSMPGGKNELRKIAFEGDVFIKNMDERQVSATGKPGKTVKTAAPVLSTLQSDSGEVDLKTNLATFTGHVKVRDSRMNLDCDKLLVQTADSGKKSTAMTQSDLGKIIGSPGSGGKSLKKIDCLGHVVATENRGTLKTDHLELFFVPNTAGKAAVGAFSSGDTSLVRILCHGNMHMRSIPQPEADKKATNDGAIAANMPLNGMFKRGSSSVNELSADEGAVDLRKNTSEFHGNVHARDEEISLKSQDLYLFAKAAAPKKAPTAAQIRKAAEDDIDADPLELVAKADVPSQFSLGEGRELHEVIARKNVIISRNDKERKATQQAFGDKAHYIVAERKIYLTGTPEERPLLKDSVEGAMRGDRVVVNLANERMHVEGDGQLETKGFKLK